MPSTRNILLCNIFGCPHLWRKGWLSMSSGNMDPEYAIPTSIWRAIRCNVFRSSRVESEFGIAQMIIWAETFLKTYRQAFQNFTLGKIWVWLHELLVHIYMPFADLIFMAGWMSNLRGGCSAIWLLNLIGLLRNAEKLSTVTEKAECRVALLTDRGVFDQGRRITRL